MTTFPLSCIDHAHSTFLTNHRAVVKRQVREKSHLEEAKALKPGLPEQNGA